MKIDLYRLPSHALTTLGVLLVNGVYECVTLEDQVRKDNPATPQNEGAKVYGETAIPAGRYKLTITMSPKFGKEMILVNDVPGFTGIRFHSLNTKEDTLGCVGVGVKFDSPVRVSGGSVAMPILFAKVKEALKAEEVWFDVHEPV